MEPMRTPDGLQRLAVLQMGGSTPTKYPVTDDCGGP